MRESTSYKFTIARKWYLIDARTYTFGRVATRIVNLLQGKHKASFSPQTDSGDFVIVVNARYLKVSHFSKWNDKMYYHYSGYPGGINETNLKGLASNNANEIIKRAVFGMLPKNKLRAPRMNRLKLFTEEKEGRELYEAMRKSRNV